MTLDDLAKLYYAGWFKIANKRGGAKDEAERAGIRAVVEALRDEISRMEQLVGVVMSNAHVSGSGILDEILSSDAEGEAAGGEGENLHVKGSALLQTPAAPTCEWTSDEYEGAYTPGCSTPSVWYSDGSETPKKEGYNFCPSCGKPIHFQEPQ